MASLFSALHASSDTLKAYEQTLSVIQNNVGNASTPGYVEQQPLLDAVSLQINGGLGGGVTARDPISAKDAYADASVRRETSQQSFSAQQAATLTGLQSSFDVTGASGVAAAFNQTFAAFSAFAASPANPSVRSGVLAAAGQLAAAIQSAAHDVSQQSAVVSSQIRSTTGQINQLSAKLQQLNVRVAQGGRNDPALDAETRTTLESLSKLVNITARTESDGTVTVLLGGQTPLVLGERQYAVSSGLAAGGTGGTPSQIIQDASGKDVTAQVTGGALGALLVVRNTTIPGLIGDQSQPGSLNQLAQSFADRVNGLLTSGIVSAGPPPVNGASLFTYDSSTPNNIAATLAINPAATAAGLAAASATSSNGTANALAGLTNSSNPADQINGQTFTAFYAAIAAGVGQQLSNATSQQSLDQHSLLQVINLRAQTSGVSLATEAERLIEFQRAYQAAAKLVTVLDQLAQTAVSLIS